MAEELNRKYSMEDELMVTRAYTQQSLLDADKALFAAKFPWIDNAYILAYKTDIETADAFPQNNTVLTDQKILTADVNALVAEARNALRQLFIYAQITYPDDKVKQRVFGQDQMDKARNDQEKMENLLEHAHTMANKNPYKTDLIAKGYTQTEIDGLLTLSDNINSKNILQEAFKANRPVTTQERIAVHNVVYDRMKTISLCAQVVFAGDAAKIKQYRVYPPSSGNATTATIRVVDPSNNPVSGVSVRLTNTALSAQNTNASGTTGSFNLGTSPPDAVDIEVTGASISPHTQTFPGKDILDGEDNLILVTVGV